MDLVTEEALKTMPADQFQQYVAEHEQFNDVLEMFELEVVAERSEDDSPSAERQSYIFRPTSFSG